MDSDGSLDIGMFIVVGVLFFVIPLFFIGIAINWLATRWARKHNRTLPKYYLVKLLALSIVLLVIGLFAYDALYKLND